MLKIEKCPLCDRGKKEKLYTGIDNYYSKKKINYDICCNCSLIFLNPRPTESEYEEMYKTVFQDKRRGITTYEEAIKRLEDKNILEKRKSLLKYFNGLIKKGDRCLDIGAGYGQIAKVVKDHFKCEMDTVEPSTLGAEVAKKYLELNAYNLTFEDFIGQYGNKKQYDFIYSYYVLEHLLDINDFFVRLKKILKPSGKFLAAVPNVYNPDLPLDRFFHIEHTYYYTPNTIRMFFEKYGFEIEKIIEDRYDMKIIGMNKSRQELTKFKNDEYSQIKKALKKYENKFKFLRFSKKIVYCLAPTKWRKLLSVYFSKFFKSINFIKR